MNAARFVLLGALIAVAGACASLQPGGRPADTRDSATPEPCLQGTGLDAIAEQETIKDIQARLILLGYGAGPVDGVLGERTRGAIRTYQADHGLLTDGLATPELSQHLRMMSSLREEMPAPSQPPAAAPK
ncbi:MAG: peptidoglycan-binding protein [Gammaproteobacteria bacterium]|nr:peptidoglycan-binding protein [Gammaproteobacteria bacterium]